MNEQSKPYPYEPPFEDQVVFYQGAEQKPNPVGAERTAKICPVCNYPIHIRMVSEPCRHFFCYECFIKNTYFCGHCGSLNSKITRIDDDAIMFTCDSYCSKAFDTLQDLEAHNDLHNQLKQLPKKKK